MDAGGRRGRGGEGGGFGDECISGGKRKKRNFQGWEGMSLSRHFRASSWKN